MKYSFMCDMEIKGNILYDKDGSAVTVYTKDKDKYPTTPCKSGYHWVYLITLEGWHRELNKPEADKI